MKDEIKKLFPIEFYIKKDKMYAEVSLENLNKIVDYITNLQEENERLNKLIELHIDKEDNLVDETIYKSRNEKAIEYINESSIYHTENGGYHTMYLFAEEYDNLLNILQGSDKDE